MGTEKERLQEVFDNWYYKDLSVTTEKYSLNEHSQTFLFNDYLKWRVFLNILQLVKPSLPVYNIFDAGCGNGNALRKLIEHGAQPENCYGIDISADAIAYAKKHFAPDITFQQGFIDQTDFADNFFDLIFCLGVLIHILDDEYIRLIAKEFSRVIKPDGIAIITVSDADLNPNWGTIAHTSRNFSVSKGELQSLFPQFECIGIYHSHNDFYPAEVTNSQVLGYIEKNMLNTAFKTFVFRPKS